MGEAIKTEGTDAHTWQFRRWHLFLLSCAILYFGPITQTHPEQDQCTFGTGSTQLYDRLYTEAGQFLSKRGKFRLRDRTGQASIEFKRKLKTQFAEFASTRETFAERLAAIHALLRHYGMEFDSIWIGAPNLPLDDPRNRMRANYFIYLPKLNWLCPTCYILRTGEFKVHINHSGDGVYDDFGSTLTRKARLTGIWPFQYGRKNEVCPRDLIS